MKFSVTGQEEGMIDRCIKTDQELKWKYLKYDCTIWWLTF
jgi:hypothetical protein